MVFFVREENWSWRFFDRAETTATAQNCKQFEHLDCDLLNSETFFCNEKTPNQTRPDVFSRTINTTCKCMKLDCDLWVFKLDFFLWRHHTHKRAGSLLKLFYLVRKIKKWKWYFLFVKKTGRDVFSIVLKLLLLLKIASNLSILFLSRTNTKPKSLMFFFSCNKHDAKMHKFGLRFVKLGNIFL